MKHKILLNVCCAPDSTHSINTLREEGYEPITYFYNPNVHPYPEYIKRAAEMEKTALEFKTENIIDIPWDAKEWFVFTKPFAKAKEGGERCGLCFKYRMEKSAQKAKELGINLFTTTLTISPHKNAALINNLGLEAAEKFGIKYLETNFKKKDGFKKSIALSHQHGLYRQDYCGCSYSLVERKRAGRISK